MNNCNISGIVRHANVRGSSPKVLSFVVETRQVTNDSERKDRPVSIPCLLFNPTADVEALLAKNGDGMNVEFEGRLSSSSYQTRTETRHTCEVIVRAWTLVIQPTFATAG